MTQEEKAVEAAVAEKAAVVSRAVTGVTAVTGGGVARWAAQREIIQGLWLSWGLAAVKGVRGGRWMSRAG